MVGGKGRHRTPQIAARYANEFNVPFESAEQTTALFERVQTACGDIGRNPASLVYSNALVLCCGDSEAELARRAEAIGRGVDELRSNGLAGSPAELVDKISRYRDAGSQRIYLQVLDLSDLDQLQLVADQVMPQV